MNLWPHQKAGVEFFERQGSCGFWFDMRTGKTLTALACGMAMKAERALILAPRVPAKGWLAQIQEHVPDFPAPILLNEGSVTERVAELREHWVAHKGRVTPIMNYEAATREPMRAALLACEWPLLIMDEVHRGKGPTSITSKLLREKLRQRAKRRIGLSGTPTPQGYVDYYGVYSAISRDVFGLDYWTHFKRRYVVCGNPRIPQQITGFRDTDEIDARVKKWAISVKEADCWDVPVPDESWLWVDLCDKTRKAYDALEADMIAEVEHGEIVASNALVKALRLQQLAGGVGVVGEGEECKPFRMSDEKGEELAGFLEDRFEPVVVFAQFLADLDATREVASRLGRPYSQISAGLDGESAFHDSASRGLNPIIGCQIQAGSEGIELSDARIEVFLSTGYSSFRYSQARARIKGHKQKHRCHFVHIGARNTIDEAVAEALEKKLSFEQAVLARLHYKGAESA